MKMSKIQFNFDEECLYSPLSLGVVDISSDLEDTFIVEPGNVPQLEERFRIKTTGSNLMAAFLRSSIATLFPHNEENMISNTEIDTAGPQLERDLMDLVEGTQTVQPPSLSSFMDRDFEETNLFPGRVGENTSVNVKSYGRPTAATLPTPRAENE